MTSGAYEGHLFDGDGECVELHGYRVDALTDVALDILRRRDDDRPRLLFVSYLEPHHQNNRFRTIGPKGWASRFEDYDVPADLAGRLGDWRWNDAEYLACCASIDANLGRILDAIDDTSRLDDTLIVYSTEVRSARVGGHARFTHERRRRRRTGADHPRQLGQERGRRQ